MLMQTMSQGAMGSGISSAVARTLGSGDEELIAQLARHALALNVLIGIAFSVVLLAIAKPLSRRSAPTAPHSMQPALTAMSCFLVCRSRRQ
jgi:Na+-driven multidrug efflux pump